MTLERGQLVDRYRIEALLGEGGMGAVYRAYDAKLQRPVALKVLRPRTDGPTGGVSHVLREARAAAALSHPSAVVIHDVGEADGVAYISMELVDGISLRGSVGGDASVAQRLSWLVDVAKVLAAAHKAGLVHRDVKPDNVMVRPDGSIKVLDFGIARRLTVEVDPSAPTLDSAGAMTDTGEAVVAGTPAYMAPEQFRGGGVDGRSDQFSWGVMAYELLGGLLPWRAHDHVEMIAAILMDEPAPLATVAPEVGATVSRVVAKAMSKAPGERFASMDEVLEALDGRRPVSARAPLSTRARVLIATAGAIVVATAAGVALRSAAPPRDHRAPSAAPSAVAATPRAITAHPDPDGCNDAAKKAHREGLHALRQIGWDVAQRAFEAAIAADPGCAAPYLRLALMGPGLSMSSARVRTTYQTAAQLSGNLTARERELLDLAEPCIVRDPPDRQACARRALPVADRYPDDAEVLAWVADFAKETPQHEALLRRALEIDPSYADVWQAVAIARLGHGDVRAAAEALDKCVAAAPASTDCRFERVRIDLRGADCKAAERHARDWTARTPGQAFPQMFLANALAAQGEPRGVVEEALRARWPALEEESREFVAALEGAQVAALFGDFAAARAALDGLARQADGHDYARRAEVAVFTARLAEEEGRRGDAVKAAATFLQGARVWPYPTVFTAYAWPSAPTAVPVLLTLQSDAGGLPATDLVARIAAWSDDAATTGRVPKLTAFAFGASSLSSSEREAADAISAAPVPIVPTRVDLDGALIRARLGRLLQRARRDEEALAYFRTAASDCMPLVDPFSAVRAQLWLGDALERRGDRDAACARYASVLSRWGKSKSITATDARARHRALACR